MLKKLQAQKGVGNPHVKPLTESEKAEAKQKKELQARKQAAFVAAQVKARERHEKALKERAALTSPSTPGSPPLRRSDRRFFGSRSFDADFPNIDGFTLNIDEPITNCFVQPNGVSKMTENFNKFLKGKFLSKVPYLMFMLSNAIANLYSTINLRQLGSCNHLVAKNQPHIKKFHVLIIPARVLGQNQLRGDHTELAIKLHSHYLAIFDKNADDKVSIAEDISSTSQDLMHYFIVATRQRSQSENDDEFDSKNPRLDVDSMDIIAAASAHHDEFKGTNLSWIGCSKNLILSNKMVNNQKADDKFFDNRGLGTLLIILMQHVLKTAEFETTVWAQINIKKEMPEAWYRKKLFLLLL